MRQLRLAAALHEQSRGKLSVVGFQRVVAICLHLTCACSSYAADRPLRTGREFRQALDEPLAAVWQNTNLRTIARGIGATRRVSILLDRRVDPSCDVTFEATGEPLKIVLESLAAASGAATTIVGNTVYLGPREAVEKIGALIERKRRDLAQTTHEISTPRRSELNRSFDAHWNDLDSPADILESLAAQHRIQIDAVDAPIPFDLWGGALLPQVSPIEAFSLLLIQFDLTFDWVNRGHSIRLVKAPPLHELDIRKTPAPSAKAAPRRDKQPTMAQQRYSLQAKNIPLRALLQKLEGPAQGGLSFAYDEPGLRKAGIDLDQKISLDVTNATIEELLREALEQTRLQFVLEGRVVRLSLRE